MVTEKQKDLLNAVSERNDHLKQNAVSNHHPYLLCPVQNRKKKLGTAADAQTVLFMELLFI